MNRLLAIVMAVLLWGQLAARDHAPDFNFPKDVTALAEADLKAALAQGDGQMVVDALVRSSLAKSSISIENMTGIVEDIDRVARKETRPDIRALLYHLEARVMKEYSSYFTPLDRRNAEGIHVGTSEKVADRYAYWDSYQFAQAIDSLVWLSVRDRDILLQKPIKDYSNIIKCDDLGAKYVPTLYHFVNYGGQNLASSRVEKQLNEIVETATPGNAMATVYAKCHPLGNYASYQKEYQAVYEEFADVAEGGLPLSYLNGDKHYDTFRQYVKRFPKSIYANDIRNSIAHIERKEASVDFDGHLNSKFSAHAEQARVKAKVKVRNINDLSVRIYRLPEDIYTDAWSKKDLKLSDMTLVAEQAVHVDGTVPFEGKAEVAFDALPYGRYILMPVYKNEGKEVTPASVDKNRTLAVYDLASFCVHEAEPREAGKEVKRVNRVYVVDDATGKPVEGATVTISKEHWSVKTARDGSVDLPANMEYQYHNYLVSKGDDRYAPSTAYNPNRSHAAEGDNLQVFTDLGIYRPGETVQWAGILYHLSNESHEAVAGRQVYITVYDANAKVIDEQTATTDEFGRVEGSYVISGGRLLGTYRISIGLSERDALGSRYFEVSEYKTPTFYVEFPETELAFKHDAPITITGKAATYSGLPLANAEVKLKLTKCRWDWRWWHCRPLERHDEAVADTIVRTDAQGQFRATFDNKLFYELRDSHHYSCYYNYLAHAQVTDATGESQEASAGFHIGNKRELNIATHNIDHNNMAPLKLPLTVNTTDSSRLSVALTYRLIRAGSADTIGGTLTSDSPVIDLTRLPSGSYDLRVMPADDPAAYVWATVNLYRTTDRQAPIANQALWLPADGHHIDSNNVAHVTIGTSTPEAHIYYVASGRGGMLGDGWIDCGKPGFREFTFNVPAKADEVLTLKFISFHHGKSFEGEVSMVVPACRQTLRVTATSFRDKLVPGKPERWQFTLKDKDGKPRRGALMLEMFDKALNSLKDNTWSFAPGYYRFNAITTDASRAASSRTTSNNWRAPSLDTKEMSYSAPALYLYGRSFWQGCRNPFETPRLLEMRAMGVAATSYNKVDKRLFDGGVESDEATEQPEVDRTKLDGVEMRLSDVKTALWQPMLTSDEQGNVSLEFDAPNFNTTWLLQAIGYTGSLASDIFNAEVLTQKPIMVKSSLPRFARQGDVTRLSANLQNATDHAIRTQALIEVFDPRSGVVYAQQSFNETIEPMGTKPLMMSWTVPDTIPFAGFRVRAVGDDFGDGEQVMLPVLTAASPIIETIPFFLDAHNGHSRTGHTFTLPAMPDNARVTLEYCDNPVWQCVTALPSIFSDNTHVATSIAHSMYALNVARGVATGQPIIAEAFRYWQENASDSMLVSSLERNADLKIGTLTASPWLRAAERKTLQMQQLASYFDAEKARAEHDRLVQALAGLQQADGGFTWYAYPGCTSSRWTTGTVLEILGDLRQLGYQPADDRLEQMTRRALEYYDKEYVAESKKKENKKTVFSTYAYTRSLHDHVPMGKDAQKLYSKTVKQMAKQWGKLDLSLTGKAFYAMALERGGKHKEALRLTESLRQFALTKPEAGMYWDQLRNERWFTPSQVAATSVILRALNAVDPRADELDQVRKWMLLSKRTTDWGGSSLAADAVQALLSTGSQWLERGLPPAVVVDGRRVEIDRFDSFVGYSRMDIDARAGSQVVINRNDNSSPAWGALYVQYSQPMPQVQAAQIDEVSISKEYVALDAAEQPTSGKAIAVGDKVRVRLIIECHQAMDYVTVTDERASCFEPADKTSGYRYQEGIGHYRETRDSATNLFFDRLPKGTHVITYDVFATAPGTFAGGIATLQSQQAPEMSAHSAGQQVTVVH